MGCKVQCWGIDSTFDVEGSTGSFFTNGSSGKVLDLVVSSLKRVLVYRVVAIW